MFIDCKLGRSKEALDLSQRLLNENPDNQPLRTYLRTGDYAGERCALRTTGPVH
jgi:hypothetical protein